MLEGEGDLVREVQGGRQADQHDVLVLRGKDSSKIMCPQLNAVPRF